MMKNKPWNRIAAALLVTLWAYAIYSGYGLLLGAGVALLLLF